MALMCDYVIPRMSLVSSFPDICAIEQGFNQVPHHIEVTQKISSSEIQCLQYGAFESSFLLISVETQSQQENISSTFCAHVMYLSCSVGGLREEV